MTDEELKVRLAAKLVAERAFMEQTVKAIEHYEQNRLDGPHVAHIITLLHKSYKESQMRIAGLEAPELSSDTKLTKKYGQPYMEK